jgi:hypothetical protein
MNAMYGILLLLAIVQLSMAFKVGTQLSSRHVSLQKGFKLYDEAGIRQETPEAAEPDFLDAEDPKMFDMNRIVRLGRSKDQDGKSNIWSIEPKMEVIEEEPGSSDLKKNLLIGGIVIGAALFSLPLFSAFSNLFPDPSDF